MLNPQIPLAFLPHRVTLKTILSTDCWGNPTYSNLEIANVRVSLESNIIQKGNIQDSFNEGILYYDCENSSPQNLEFLPNMQIINFNGVDYKVTYRKVYMGLNGNHHIKVGLGGV